MKEFELGGANGSANDSGGSKGEREGRAPPGGPNSLNFMQFFEKIWQNRMLEPPRGVGAPSSGKSWIRH